MSKIITAIVALTLVTAAAAPSFAYEKPLHSTTSDK